LKKAEIVADQIEQTIVGQRWEPGDLFGSEVELIARYGVSRAVFREAVRLLEHHGLAEMRRGLHGGLFIVQPDPKPVAKAMAVYLDFEKVEPRQLDDARLAIEVFCVERVAARISEDEVAEVRAFLAAETAQFASARTPSLHEFHVMGGAADRQPCPAPVRADAHRPDPAAAAASLGPQPALARRRARGARQDRRGDHRP
jgi:DNA-binding FadR family transcriptional regulator